MSKAFLDVERSWTNKRWESRPFDERMTETIAQRYELPDALAQSLSARGVKLDDVPSFLDPKLRDLMPDPSRFVDMDVSVARLVHAIIERQQIVVFGDYDVDGATSTALLMRFLLSVQALVDLYIPDRMKEGYGPNPEAMRKIAKSGAKLVVCVDCGVSAHAALNMAKEIGLDVIVIDHHAAEAVLPPAVGIVNPNRLDEPLASEYGALAAVGVTYLVVIAANRVLRQKSYYAGKINEPDILQWLDLVALGTVCDVVQLKGLNRAYVAQGLKIMSRRQNKGISALANVSAFKGVFDAYTAGFVLGPRINAGGRVGLSSLGARLLVTDDDIEASTLAEKLNQNNADRKELEGKILSETDLMFFDEKAPIIFVSSEDWHAGVIGIAASRLKDKFHRPTFVASIQGEIAKGSARSVGMVDVGAAIIAARQEGLLLNGGGHKMAGGFTAETKKLSALKEFLSDRISKQIGDDPLIPTVSVDALVSMGGINEEFLDKLSALAPYGTGNPEPRYGLANCKIVRASIVGEKHVSLIVTQGPAKMKAIAFRAMETELGPNLLSPKPAPCHLIGHIRRDDWKNDGSAQLYVDDASGAISG